MDKYTWVNSGSSYLPSDILAAFLYAQLEKRASIQVKRQRVWDYYNSHLREWARQHGVGTPHIPAYCEQPYHMYYLIMPSLAVRQALIAHLRANGILSVFHYLPLNTSAMGVRFGGKPGDCPVTERVSDCLVRLPFFNNLSEMEQSQVVESIQNFKM